MGLFLRLPLSPYDGTIKIFNKADNISEEIYQNRNLPLSSNTSTSLKYISNIEKLDTTERFLFIELNLIKSKKIK